MILPVLLLLVGLGAAQDNCPKPLSCPNGWTGQLCDIPLCDNKGTAQKPHENLGFAIDIIPFKDTCQGQAMVPVDSKVEVLFIIIDGKDNGANPSITLYDPTGAMVQPSEVVLNDSKTLVLGYIAPKPGVYSTQFSASMPCIFQSHAQTRLVVALGTVSGQRAMHNDNPSVQQTENEFSYAVAHVFELPHPGRIRVLELYENGQLLHAYDPKYRFRCAYELVFGPLVCKEEAYYHYKLYGIDENGYYFMRTDTVYCKGGGQMSTTGSFTFTTPTGPPMTTGSPGQCQNGGVWDSGLNFCVCPPMWTGSDCSQIVCFNGGTPQGNSACTCASGFSGTFCEERICDQQNPIPPFNSNGKSIAFVIQNTFSMRVDILQIFEYIGEIIEEFQQHHPDFIKQYAVITFDDQKAETLTVTNKPLFAIDTIHHIQLASNRNTTCQKRGFDGIQQALANSLNYGYVYVFTDSPVVVSPDTIDKVFSLIESTKTEIDFFLTMPSCNISQTDPSFRIMFDFAELSGGYVNFFASKRQIRSAVRSMSLAYKRGKVMEHRIDECQFTRSMYFPVDSHTSAFNFVVDGFQPDITIYDPRGYPFPTVNIIDDTYTKTVQAITPCGFGWDMHDNKCFYGSLIPKTWQEAQADCHSMGAVLVSIINPEKQNFINDETKGFNYWTGLNDLNVQGNYYWDSLSDPIPLGHWYLNWGPNQPGSGRCVGVVFNSNDSFSYYWQTMDCSMRMPYVCQRHAFDSKKKLDGGIWRADIRTSQGAFFGNRCSARAYVQSDLEVYFGFTSAATDDYPKPEPIYGNNATNYLVVNMTGLTDIAGIEYVNVYDRDETLEGSLRMHYRGNCAYNWVSDGFVCPRKGGYGLFMTGVDEKGFAVQRMRSGICLSSSQTTSGVSPIREYLGYV